MTARIALASTNGRDVDAHFGSATRFEIYVLSGGEASFEESRPGLPYSASGHGGVPKPLQDCAAVIAARVGRGAAAALIAGGLRVFEAAGPIDAVLASLARNGLASMVRERQEPCRWVSDS